MAAVLAVLFPVLQALAPTLGKVLGDILESWVSGKIDHDAAVSQMHQAISDEATKNASFLGALQSADADFASKIAALKAQGK